MKETPKRAGRALLVLAAVFLVLAFGAGALVGRSSRKPKPPAEEQSAETFSDPRVAKALSACRQKLAARADAGDAASATATAPGGTNPDAQTPAAKVEALKGQIEACRKSEVLINAGVCSAVGRHYAAMMALPDNGVSCIQRARATAFIEEDFEKCDDFEEVPADLDANTLTKEELKSIMDAVHVRKTLKEEELAEKLGDVRQTCFDTAEKQKHR